jgi:hypothetical protein
LRVSLPIVAKALAAKAVLSTESKDLKARPVQAPVVVHDKVLTGQA